MNWYFFDHDYNRFNSGFVVEPKVLPTRVDKTAENKLNIFAEFLVENSQILKSTIIFVEEQEYGNQLLDNIHNYTFCTIIYF